MAAGFISVNDWQDLVIGRLPAPDQVILRNYALTAQYARWYQARPGILKWAGMASFSSHRVGLALTPYQIIVDAEQIIDIVNPEIPLPRKAELLPGLNLLRETNNAVFEDIGWAHEAYIQGGLAAVEAAVGSDMRYQDLKRGFQEIDAGLQLRSALAPGAEDRIWEGNLRLLYHEQRNIIQPRLDKVTLLFDRFLSAATVMKYWVNPLHLHPDKMTAFPWAMLVFGFHILIADRCPPEFRDFDQRWFWIQKRVVPIFRRLDGSDPEINSSIAEIIEAGNQTIPPPQRLVRNLPNF